MKMSSIPKTDNETLTDLLKRAAAIQKLKVVNVENEWTEFLKHYFSLFGDNGGC
jgi:hypothetical protein